jgi:hypothetical protein
LKKMDNFCNGSCPRETRVSCRDDPLSTIERGITFLPAELSKVDVMHEFSIDRNFEVLPYLFALSD